MANEINKEQRISGKYEITIDTLGTETIGYEHGGPNNSPMTGTISEYVCAAQRLLSPATRYITQVTAFDNTTKQITATIVRAYVDTTPFM